MSLGIPALQSGLSIGMGILSGALGAQSMPSNRVYALLNPDDNSIILEWDSCVYFDYHNESMISDAPQEAGAFISYNKVATPFTIRTRATVSNANNRAAFLTKCETVLDSLSLYKFATPDKVYQSVNLVSLDYHRGADGGYSLISVDIILREVRINKDTRYSNQSAEPAGADTQSSGQIPPITDFRRSDGMITDFHRTS